MKELLRALLYQFVAPSPLSLLQRALELGIGIAGLLSAYYFDLRNRRRHPVTITAK